MSAAQARDAARTGDADRWAVYLVTDADQCAASGRSVPDTVAAAVAAGVRAVQVRAKDAHGGGFLAEVLAVADALAATLGGEDTALIVNDRIDIALAARAAGARVDGVHVGQSDLPAASVRAGSCTAPDSASTAPAKPHAPRSVSVSRAVSSQMRVPFSCPALHTTARGCPSRTAVSNAGR